MVSSALADRSYRPSPQGFSLEPASAQLYAAFAHETGSSPIVRCNTIIVTKDAAL